MINTDDTAPKGSSTNFINNFTSKLHMLFQWHEGRRGSQPSMNGLFPSTTLATISG